ncbi:MAG TPA: hypothetical protein VEQ63_03315, partial [Bryobacteraceae bacterium]|nr:hypothetical protein [Bryobacteraceae bacterium]
AAILTQGDLLFALTTNSELLILRTGAKGLQPVRKYEVADSPVWAHPAISGSRILIKDKETLSMWSFQ